ncbi:hypothetical protein LCGC14_1968110 [marine sediment metagenome]|uniref:Uncharacterized protein n=1 Tax=marine sediment metagenome TaxID=412755 RepID=A0A0F9G0R7_9ZZZZ|nr:hypothetical protein [archaeon]
MDLDDYKTFFLEGRKNINPIIGICGRILRGKLSDDFETLSDDPQRKIIMLMGADGLEKLLGKSGYEVLITIGYMLDYIEYKVKSGFQFKLVIFNEGEIAKLATWDNVVLIVSQIYPQAKTKIYHQLEELKITTFSEIERVANRKFNIIDKNGPKDKNFMTYERFINSEGTLIDVRAFLFHTVHLRELFSGDGFIYEANGERGLNEYIAPNCKLEELKGYILIDMTINLPK